MANILTLLFNGISEGALYFLMASSLSIILGLMGVVNFAHGALFVWGAYVFRMVFIQTGSFFFGIMAAMVAGFVIGFIFEKLFVSRVYGNVGAQIMITLGLSIVFTELIRVFWGPTPLIVTRPEFLAGVSHIQLGGVGTVIISHYRLFLIIVGVVIAILGHLLLTKTRIGMTIRAGVQSGEMVSALGININLYFTLVFAAGGALAGLGGALFAPLSQSINPEIGNMFQLDAFIVVVIGGMGSFMGSAVGSLFIAIMIALIGWYVPALSSVAPVTIMALVLIFRPQGLFSLLGLLRQAVKK
ncbi:MAG: branched-chain amino acid ABC transporter permease [Defluviitaleaceae bacterium]|nr:branched-chain amino acid ABC transporter permease [Defluviitaleaceae bacterium]